MASKEVKKVTVDGKTLVIDLGDADISKVVIKSEKTIQTEKTIRVKKGQERKSTLSSDGESRASTRGRLCG